MTDSRWRPATCPGFIHTAGPGPANTALAGALSGPGAQARHPHGRCVQRPWRTLHTASVTLRSVAAARTALGHRSHGFRSLTHVGNQAFISVTSSTGRGGKTKSKKKGTKHRTPTGSVTATVVLRVQRGIGVIRLTVPRKTGNNARLAAVGYAQTLAARLKRVLSLTTWDQTIDQVNTDGSYAPKVALRAFALV